MNLFDQPTSHDSVFRSETALSMKRSSGPIVDRKEEIQEIANTLRPLIRGSEPEDVLVHGPAGTGKTTCVRHVFDQLSDETAVRTAFINCWQYNTRPALLSELLNDIEYMNPRKGNPIDTLCSKLREWLDKNRNVALALDEFDQFKDKAAVIYDLKQIGTAAENDLGLVLIANKQLSQLELDPRSQSRLSCQLIQFHRYEEDELETILTERAEQAFHPGRVSDQVPALIANIVGENDGDCRKALHMLLRAGRKADRENADKVTLEYVDQSAIDEPG